MGTMCTECSRARGIIVLIEEHIDFVDVKIQHHQLYQHVVWHVVDRGIIITPQTVFLLEFLYEIRLD